MADLPEGSVTFLFSDVEGSTRLLELHGAEMGQALARHHAIFEAIVFARNGVIFETVGDAVYAAFAMPSDTVAASIDAHRQLASEDWGPVGRLAVRIAIHTGQVERRGAHYFGSALFRAARLQALGYGEQSLLSAVTARIVADALPTGASLRDLGQHRLKDLSEPEHVFQVVADGLRAEFPALKSLDSRPHNLPVQATSFVGRQAEMDDIGARLKEARLITLLGPGGIGKTRLALQIAAEQLDGYPDGAWFVDLAPVRDPTLMAAAIATALGLRERSGESFSTTLADHLRAKRMLLLLDNVEQLLPDAADTVAEVVAAAPDVRLLVTSRAPLRIRAEHEYTVPALTDRSDVPDDEPSAASTLFVERARAAGQEMDLDATTRAAVEEICQRLDGLPLAIELAAARLRMFSLAQLRARLEKRLSLLTGGARDLPDRQRTLMATVAWSDELLDPPERLLLARLSVFVGGFGLEAAEEVASTDLRSDPIDGVERLLEHSLLRRTDAGAAAARYSMLETVREYALERLAVLDETDTHQRHAEYFGRLAQEVAGELAAAEQGEWFDALHAERYNLAAAIEWAARADRADLAQLMLTPISRYWLLRGEAAEAARLAVLAVTAKGDVPAAQRAGALRVAGRLVADAGDQDAGYRMLEESVAFARASDEPTEVYESLLRLAEIRTELRRWDEARESLSEAAQLPIERTAQQLAKYHWSLGLLQLAQGEPLASAESFAAAVDHARIAADTLLVGVSAYYRGVAELQAGDLSQATTSLESALEIARRFDDRFGALWAHAALASAFVQLDDVPRAVAAIDEVLGWLSDPAAAKDWGEDWGLGATAFDVVASLLGAEDDAKVEFVLAARAAAGRDPWPNLSPSLALRHALGAAETEAPSDPGALDWGETAVRARSHLRDMLARASES